MLEHPSASANSYESFDQKATEITVVRPDPQILVSQQLANFVGLSANTAGAKGISMQLMVMPPGAVAQPHFHPEHETALYLLQGRVEVFYGKGLKQRKVCETGDLVFTPPGVPHQPRNLIPI
jgi:uncharacterized RmlC-like cupin family protein